MSDKNMLMSEQAAGAIMMALQQSLLEQSDILPVLKGFKFRLSENGLMVMNPPLVKFNEKTEESLQNSNSQPYDFDVVTEQPSQK